MRNYLEYQPSKAERDSANKAAAERMRNMRARKSDYPHWLRPELPVT